MKTIGLIENYDPGVIIPTKEAMDQVHRVISDKHYAGNIEQFSRQILNFH